MKVRLELDEHELEEIINLVKRLTDTLEQLEELLEIDICKWDGKNFYLGHDEPQEAVSPAWLEGRPLWIHAKDHVALHELIDQNLHCFWHNTDRYSLTSNGWIWAYPGEPGGKRAITVFPEKNKDWKKFSGICSDNIESYKNENI